MLPQETGQNFWSVTSQGFSQENNKPKGYMFFTKEKSQWFVWPSENDDREVGKTYFQGNLNN